MSICVRECVFECACVCVYGGKMEDRVGMGREREGVDTYYACPDAFKILLRER